MRDVQAGRGCLHLPLAVFGSLHIALEVFHLARQVHHGPHQSIELLTVIVPDVDGFFVSPAMLALPRVEGASFLLPAFLVLFAGVTTIAAPLVYFALDLVGAIAPKGRSVNKKELRCVTKAGNLQNEETTAAKKTSCDCYIKSMGKCRAHLGHVTSGSVSYGSFHLGHMKANL